MPISLSSPSTGEYDDPNHPGCLRSVKVVGAKLDAAGRRGPPLAYVKGVDGLPAGTKSCPKGSKPSLSDVWNLEGKVSVVDDVDTITIDFAPKTDGKVGLLAGKFDDFNGQPGILFPDGNKVQPHPAPCCAAVPPASLPSRPPPAHHACARGPHSG